MFAGVEDGSKNPTPYLARLVLKAAQVSPFPSSELCPFSLFLVRYVLVFLFAYRGSCACVPFVCVCVFFWDLGICFVVLRCDALGGCLHGQLRVQGEHN